jgi:transcriptional regulator with XRE-family HTH domain
VSVAREPHTVPQYLREVPVPDEPSNSTFRRVLGDELRRARKSRGWTRKELRARLPHDLSVQTLATYELGTRSCSAERLYELCETMGVFTHDVLARVRERLTGQDDQGRLVLDLDRVLRDKQRELLPLRRWAKERLSEAGQAAVKLEPFALDQLAELCGLQRGDLIERLGFLVSPSVAPQVLTQVRLRPILEPA